MGQRLIELPDLFVQSWTLPSLSWSLARLNTSHGWLNQRFSGSAEVRHYSRGRVRALTWPTDVAHVLCIDQLIWRTCLRPKLMWESIPNAWLSSSFHLLVKILIGSLNHSLWPTVFRWAVICGLLPISVILLDLRPRRSIRGERGYHPYYRRRSGFDVLKYNFHISYV